MACATVPFLNLTIKSGIWVLDTRLSWFWSVCPTYLCIIIWCNWRWDADACLLPASPHTSSEIRQPCPAPSHPRRTTRRPTGPAARQHPNNSGEGDSVGATAAGCTICRSLSVSRTLGHTRVEVGYVYPARLHQFLITRLFPCHPKFQVASKATRARTHFTRVYYTCTLVEFTCFVYTCSG
jgi:hypothetical protein